MQGEGTGEKRGEVGRGQNARDCSSRGPKGWGWVGVWGVASPTVLIANPFPTAAIPSARLRRTAAAAPSSRRPSWRQRVSADSNARGPSLPLALLRLAPTELTSFALSRFVLPHDPEDAPRGVQQVKLCSPRRWAFLAPLPCPSFP